MNARRSLDRIPILPGCLGAVVMGILSSCVLIALTIAPAFSQTVPPPPAPDPTRPDITIVVEEAYLNQALTDAMPGSVSGEANLDVQPDNRLVVTAVFDLVLQKLEVVVTLRMSAQDGELRIAVESVEAGGEDILELLDVDRDSLSQSMSEAIHDQVEAGLGEGAQILGVATDEEHMTITARWTE